MKTYNFYGNVRERILKSIDQAISRIVRRESHSSCLALEYTLWYNRSCKTDYEFFDDVVLSYQQHSGANPSKSGFKDVWFWAIYPEWLRRQVRIKRLSDFRDYINNNHNDCLFMDNN